MDLITDLCHTPDVRKIIEQGEEDGERFLDAEEAVEGPFAVELVDRIEIGMVPRQSRVCYDVLAGIVAFSWASPEEETTM